MPRVGWISSTGNHRKPGHFIETGNIVKLQKRSCCLQEVRWDEMGETNESTEEEEDEALGHVLSAECADCKCIII